MAVLNDSYAFRATWVPDAPYTVLENTMFIHPTLAEGFFALMGNVEAV
jgi:hypothetical protein